MRANSAALARGVMLAGAALIALIAVAEAHKIWLSYRTAIRVSQETEAALGHVLGRQIGRMLQETDIVLTDVGEWSASAEGRTAGSVAIRGRMHDDVLRLQFVVAASLADSTSGAVTIARDGTGFTADIPAPNSTRSAAAAQDALLVGDPLQSAGNPGVLPVSRRITTPGGAQVTVTAYIIPRSIVDMFSDIESVPDTTIRLMRADGTLLLDFPAGGNMPPDPVATTTTDSVAANLQVEGYPLKVGLSRPLSSVLRPWFREQAQRSFSTLLLIVLTIALLTLLRSALIRHDLQQQEHRRLEQDLETGRRMDALGVLAASVAHDFNNVLSAIIGYAELGRARLKAGSPELTSIDKLLAAAQRARLLVRRVLTFDVQHNLQSRPVPVAPILAEVLEQIEATLPPTVSIGRRVLDAGSIVRGDATEIYQVLMNLCANAVQSMPRGGDLTVEVTLVQIAEPCTLTVGRLEPGTCTRVSITDSGLGLGPEQLSRIFEPFYTSRGAQQGTGIGLTVVRNILSRTDGALEVQSRKGAGTHMSVYWPAVIGLAEKPDTPAAAMRPGNGEVVLIVDDRPELVSLTEEVLASLGYEPVGFTSAQAAQQAFRNDPARFDALVTDERMEDMGGCELAHSLHKIDPRLPVVLVTGYRDADLLMRARDSGIAEILDKPLSSLALGGALARQFVAKSGSSFV